MRDVKSETWKRPKTQFYVTLCTLWNISVTLWKRLKKGALWNQSTFKKSKTRWKWQLPNLDPFISTLSSYSKHNMSELSPNPLISPTPPSMSQSSTLSQLHAHIWQGGRLPDLIRVLFNGSQGSTRKVSSVKHVLALTSYQCFAHAWCCHSHIPSFFKKKSQT